MFIFVNTEHHCQLVIVAIVVCFGCCCFCCYCFAVDY